MILTIDPGNETGWCLLKDDLSFFDFGLGDFDTLTLLGTKTLVCEIPRIRPGGPTNQIITLALTAGRLVQDIRRRCSVRESFGVFPETWKGQTPKHIHNQRVLGKMSEDERAFLKGKKIPSHLENNVIDAIGIAMWVRDRHANLDRVCDYRFDKVGWAV